MQDPYIQVFTKTSIFKTHLIPIKCISLLKINGVYYFIMQIYKKYILMHDNHDTPFSPLVVVKKRFEYIITDKVYFFQMVQRGFYLNLSFKMSALLFHDSNKYGNSSSGKYLFMIKKRFFAFASSFNSR